jgi:hypothetical protein
VLFDAAELTAPEVRPATALAQSRGMKVGAIANGQIPGGWAKRADLTADLCTPAGGFDELEQALPRRPERVKRAIFRTIQGSLNVL